MGLPIKLVSRTIYAALVLLFMTLTGLSSNSSHAECSVHNHACNYHGIGRSVNSSINRDDPNALWIISKADNDIDFDNHVLLPDDVGPYIIGTTATPVQSSQPYIAGNEQPRHVYPTQHQIVFQQSTVEATHSGDFNGGEIVPGATGCQLSIDNCEEIKIVGNIPDPGTPEGFVVKQTNHLYNYHEVDDPEATVISFAATSGNVYIKNQSHLAYDPDSIGNPNRISTVYTDDLSGTGDVGDEKVYNFGYTDFKPHAAGVSTFKNQYTYNTSGPYDVQSGHQIATQRQTTHTSYDYSISYGDINPETGYREVGKSFDNVNKWNTYETLAVRNTPEYEEQLRQEKQARMQLQESQSESYLQYLSRTGDLNDFANDTGWNYLKSIPENALVSIFSTKEAQEFVNRSQGQFRGKNGKYPNSSVKNTVFSSFFNYGKKHDFKLKPKITDVFKVSPTIVITPGVKYLTGHFGGDDMEVAIAGEASDWAITGAAVLSVGASSTAAPIIVTAYAGSKVLETGNLGIKYNDIADNTNSTIDNTSRTYQQAYNTTLTNSSLSTTEKRDRLVQNINAQLDNQALKMEHNNNPVARSINMIDSFYARSEAATEIENLNNLKNTINSY